MPCLRPSARSLRLFTVSLPQPFQGTGQSLSGDAAVGVAGGLGEDVAVGVSFRLEHGRHALIRHHPVVQRRFVALRAVVVLAHLEPRADRLALAPRDKVFVIFPSAVRRFRVRRRLLVHKRAGVTTVRVLKSGTPVSLCVYRTLMDGRGCERLEIFIRFPRSRFSAKLPGCMPENLSSPNSPT